MVYALLDSGSDHDVISQSLITNLKLDSWTEYLTVKTLDTIVEGERQLTSMRIESVDASYAVHVEGALVGSTLTGNCDIPPGKRNWSSYPHLSSLVFKDHVAELELIIGCAHGHTWMAPEVVSRGANNQPLGVKTSFGWTVVGACGKCASSSITCNVLSANNERLHQDIDQIFYNDFPIVTDQGMGLSHRTAIKLLQESIRPPIYGREKSAEILRTVDSKVMARKGGRRSSPAWQSGVRKGSRPTSTRPWKIASLWRKIDRCGTCRS